MSSPKIGWKRPRKSENKNDCFVSFLPGRKRKFHYGFISSQNRSAKDEKDRK